MFEPFFGIEAATLKAPTQLVKLGKAKVMAFTCVRKADNSGYLVEIFADDFSDYGQDEKNDAALLNRFLENRIKQYPEQYFWVHRRFKTRPDGDEDFYQLNQLKSFQRRKKRRTKAWQKKLMEKQLKENQKK